VQLPFLHPQDVAAHDDLSDNIVVERPGNLAMQAVAEFIAAIITALAAAAFAQFGVMLDPPAHGSQGPEVQRTVSSQPAPRTEAISDSAPDTGCPEHRVNAA
jgi:hypothetical protein